MAIKEFSFSDHDEWLKIRSKYIGGSDAAATIGRNPYKSRYALWAEKTGKTPGFGGNLTTEVGAYLEDMVAGLFERETGKKVRRKNRTMVNELYPFACANVDRMVVGEKALLEIKTTNSVPIMRQLKGTEFPDAYYCQVVHYMAVTGLDKAYLAVLINCRDFKVYELDRDQAEIDALMIAEKEFWELVENDTAPALDGTDSTSDTIAALYPNSDGESIDLTMWDTELATITELSAQIKALENLKKEAENKVKEYMKTAGKGETSKFKVTYASASRRSFDASAFTAEHKDIDMSPYYKESTYRTFKLTKKGDK